MATTAPTTRHHDFDALRAAAMLLGVVYHGALAYRAEGRTWMRDTGAAHVAYDYLCAWLHSFRMPLFFVMAGFFAHLLIEKRGLIAFARHRAVRVLLPFLVGALVLAPVVDGALRYGILTFRGRDPQLVLDQVLAIASRTWFFGGTLAHLWFLYYLLMISAAAALLSAAAPARAVALVDALAARTLRSPARALWLALPVLLLLLPMRGREIDTSVWLAPAPRLLAFYGFHFALGWFAHRNLNALAGVDAGWPLQLAAGALLLAPARTLAAELPARAFYAVMASLSLWGTVGLFRRLFARPTPATRYLADSAYWVYLLHLPLVTVLQVLLAQAGVWAPARFPLVVVATTAACLLSYQLLVRHTVVGAVLNGRRLDRARARRRKSTRDGVIGEAASHPNGQARAEA